MMLRRLAQLAKSRASAYGVQSNLHRSLFTSSHSPATLGSQAYSSSSNSFLRMAGVSGGALAMASVLNMEHTIGCEKEEEEDDDLFDLFGDEDEYADIEEEEVEEEEETLLNQISDTLFYPIHLLSEYFGSDTHNLLSDEVPDMYMRRPRTIVLNFEKTLVYPFWTREEGWRVRKRPHVDMFLEKLGRAGYEVVIWSNQAQFETEDKMAALDMMGVARHRFYREQTNFHRGRTVKDLKRLNRSLKRVIVIDFDKRASLPSSNCLVMEPWFEDLEDNELVRASIFLENLMRFNVHDVRKYIREYNTNSSSEDEEKRNPYYPFRKELEMEAKSNEALSTGDAKGGRGRGREGSNKKADDSDGAEKKSSWYNPLSWMRKK